MYYTFILQLQCFADLLCVSCCQPYIHNPALCVIMLNYCASCKRHVHGMLVLLMGY